MEDTFTARCNDCFCAWSKAPKYFPRNAEDIYSLLMNNGLGIDTLVFIQSLLFVIWQLFSLIQGFALYNGNPAPSTVSNLGWWSALEFVVLMLGARATGFKLNLSTNMTQLELSVANSIKYLTFYVIALIIAIVAEIIHAVLLCAELVNGSGTLATTNPVFGWIFFGMIIVMIGIDIWIAVRASIYRTNLNYANILDTSGLLFVLGKTPGDVESGSAPSLPEVDGTSRSINTPILDLVRKNSRRTRRVGQ